ncbi:hypothetical protein [Paractinoplanes atraurantiacus]|uniref:Lipoprotein LprG n=1 Tax=Paractinoplanes atraurantiacus TaxID=1036182 RepID=A0A285JBC2_9ACTN|nr:hypothetical protein [Actinoplanes atraurantiacus]SNY57569.1 hypothetical protein SAMN05421748_118137 [Actinoplanes atraurantiacus]
MRTRRTVLLVAALTGTLLAGCSKPAPKTQAPVAPSPSASAITASGLPTLPEARQDLTAAMNRLGTTTYKFAVAGDYWDKQKFRASGVHDPKAHRLSRTTVISGGPDAETAKLVLMDEHQFTTTGSSGVWTHADLTAMPANNEYRHIDAADPIGLGRFATTLTTVRRTSPHAFQGNGFIEFRRGEIAYLPLGAPVLVGTGRGFVDFTATTDGQGRITSIRTELKTKNGTLTDTVTFRDFGIEVTPSKPAGARNVPASYER